MKLPHKNPSNTGQFTVITPRVVDAFLPPSVIWTVLFVSDDGTDVSCEDVMSNIIFLLLFLRLHFKAGGVFLFCCFLNLLYF